MKIIRENIEFERGQEPSKAMGIGMTPKRILDKFVADLKKLGFKKAYWQQAWNMGKGAYEINLDVDESYSDLYGLQIWYATDKYAEEEGWEEGGGFGLANINGEHLIDEMTHDANLIIKKILELKYGKINFTKRIKELEDEISTLKNIQNQLK